MPPRKQKEPEPPPITYPARPMNGGRLEHAEPLDMDEWRYRPKYNGRRVLLHVPTMRTWNRQLEENNWVFPAFKKLLDIIHEGDLWPPVLQWLDIELSYGKTSVAKRTVIVLDYVSENEVWWDRMVNLHMAFGDEHSLTPEEVPGHGQVYFSPPLAKGSEVGVWNALQEQNKALGCTFYEGLCAYDMRAKYPIQLFSPTKETRHWIKFRFIT